MYRKHHKTSINNYNTRRIRTKCMSINQINGFCIAVLILCMRFIRIIALAFYLLIIPKRLSIYLNESICEFSLFMLFYRMWFFLRNIFQKFLTEHTK